MTTTTPTTTHDDVQAIEREIMALKQKRAQMRREIEPEPVEDYTLRHKDGTEVKLSELFGDKDEMILVHNMGRSCIYCTLWADGLNGLADHLMDRAAFVLTSPDAPDVMKEFAQGRGWRFPVASIEGCTLAHDLGFYKADDPDHSGYWPGASALRKTKDGIVRTGWTFFGPGDDFCAVWPLFDLLPEREWAPKYAYTKGGSCGSGCGCH